MNRRIPRFIPALIISAAIITLAHTFDTPVFAQAGTSQAITLSPASTEIKVNPGSIASKSVDIINTGSESFMINLTSTPYYVLGTDYDPHFTQLPGTVDASSWVHLSLTDATLTGDKTLTVPYTIDVPKNTPPGGYYAVLFAQTSTDDEKTGVVSHNRVGDILYITVNGPIENSGNLLAGSLPSVSFVGAIPISTSVSNTGGVHFVSNASYSITDFNGHTVFTAKLDRYVLPQTEREIGASWSPQSPIGLFTVHRNATVAGVLRTLPDKQILVVNPWVIVVVTFLIGLIVGIPFWRRRNRKKK
jgi:hypothetical protein